MKYLLIKTTQLSTDYSIDVGSVIIQESTISPNNSKDL